MTKLEKIIAEIDEHVMGCGGQILAADSRTERFLGWCCLECGERWKLPIDDFKKIGRFPEWVYEHAQQAPDHPGRVIRDRIELDKALSRAGVVRMWKEEPCS